MDVGTTASTATHDHTPELPMLEPTHQQTFDLLDLSRRARASRHFSAAVVLVLANDLVHALSLGEDFGRACIDTENAVTEWEVRKNTVHGHYASLFALVSLAVDAGVLKTGESVGVGDIDGPHGETPETAFADMRKALASEPDALPIAKMHCKRLEQAYLDLRAIVRRSRRAH
jgi:hypothetical protein